MRFWDISYPIREGMAIYPDNPDFSLTKVKALSDGDTADVSALSMGTHTGTHLDAPSHIIPNGQAIHQISLVRMNGMAHVLEMTGKQHIRTNDLEAFDIASDDILLLKTDNGRRFAGEHILEEYVTLDYDATRYLTMKRIKLLGTDYLTIELPRGRRTPGESVHRILMESGILILEALDLRRVPAGRYRLHCFPLNLVGADGCPVRAALEEVED